MHLGELKRSQTGGGRNLRMRIRTNEPVQYILPTMRVIYFAITVIAGINFYECNGWFRNDGDIPGANAGRELGFLDLFIVLFVAKTAINISELFV